MIKVNKTIVEGKHLYINLHGFRDEVHLDTIYNKIRELIKDHESKVRIY